MGKQLFGTNGSLASTMNRTSSAPATDPAADDIRKRIFERLGTGGLKAVARNFRNMDTDGNRHLSAAELAAGFADCGIQLQQSDVRRVFSTLDVNGDGAVSQSEFLRFLRGTLPRCRARVVEQAWEKLDTKKRGSVTVDALRVYQTASHPAVVKGAMSEEDALHEFLGNFEGPMSRNNVVTKDEFFEYYAGVSDSIDNHNYFDLVVRHAWRLDQPHDFGKSKTELGGMTTSYFQSSAYRGCSGAFASAAPEDNAGAKQQPRFASMISNHLCPFPVPKVGMCPKGIGAASHFGASVNGHKTNNAFPITPPTLDFDKSTTGTVTTMKMSRGFLEDGSTTQTMHGEFSDNVMHTYSANKQKEGGIEIERRQLQAAPYATRDPDHWTKSSQSYADFRKVDRSEFIKGNAIPRLAHGETNRDKTLRQMEAGREVDRDALKAIRDEMSKAALPSGFVPPNVTWRSTAHDDFAEYNFDDAAASNDRWANKPLQHVHKRPTEEEKQLVVDREARFNDRHNGIFVTEKSDKHRNLFAEAEISHRHDIKGAFSLRNGVRCINDKVLKPRNEPTGAQYSASQVVQGQFKTMSQQPLHIPDM